MKTVLICDDEADVLEIFSRKLSKIYKIITVNSVDKALSILEKSHVDLVMSDLVMPQKTGLEFLDIIMKEYSHIPVIVISGNATLGMAVTAMQKGAADFIEKPVVDLNLLTLVINKALETVENKNEIKRLKSLLNQDFDSSKIIGNSLAIQKVMEKVRRIANVDTTVLITGETGVGKDLFTNLIVANSERKNKRFVAVNCGSIPETLLESTLFGHKKGSFTSAIKDQIGYFEEANGGTIFLDEITETTPAFQIKLLRVLENRVVRKIGDTHDIPINVRVLTATNKSLEEEVKKGTFREDLYYRLNVIQISIPPLRERPEDIQLLSEFFMKEFSEKYKKPLDRFDPKTLNILLKDNWKGNVRELRNVIEHAVVMATHDVILPEDLPAYIYSTQKNQDIEDIKKEFFEIEYSEAKELFEKRYIMNLLSKTKGDVSKASEMSGIKREFLYTRLKKYDIDIDYFRSNI
ncbi:MAG: sigma-54 dependent transcriptional regulator [Candidatus Cloacimonetes bacterium]|nr:sigma-54 dependent transcriptional regulator [Candidatus Cloacimonadota bacterium]